MNIIYKVFTFFTFILICIAIFALRYVDTSRNLILDSSKNAEYNTFIPNIYLPKIKGKNYPLSWTINFWINIKEWDYRFHEDKYIIKWDNAEIWLSEGKNSMQIAIPLQNDSYDVLEIPNIESQKWINICFILDNRYIDCWIDGKLIKSKHLDNVPLVLLNSSLNITPYGGFRGKIGSVKVYNRPLKEKSYFYVNTIQHLYRSRAF